MGRRKRYTGEEKVKILREVLEDGKSVSQVAEGYGVHPNLILNWRKQLFEAAPKAFEVRRLYHLMKNTSNNLRGDRRIAAKLWKLSRDHGVKTAEGVEINFDLTITALAEFLGSQRETVSRQVGTLAGAGLLMVKKSRFIIPSREKLMEFFENS
jgi:DNA-binding Lrp family transcriptional regulator